MENNLQNFTQLAAVGIAATGAGLLSASIAMTRNDEISAIDLIKKHEGLRLKAYRCPAGVWTIGWGHTANVAPGMSITRQEAEALLRADVAMIEAELEGMVLTANQRAALVSFIYNVGIEAFRNSTLWEKIRQDVNHPDIPAEFARWRYAGGQEMPGLVKRRAEEAALYVKP